MHCFGVHLDDAARVIMAGIGRADADAGCLDAVVALRRVDIGEGLAEDRPLDDAHPDALFVRAQLHAVFFFAGDFAGLAVDAVLIIKRHGIIHNHTFLTVTSVSCMIAQPNTGSICSFDNLVVACPVSVGKGHSFRFGAEAMDVENGFGNDLRRRKGLDPYFADAAGYLQKIAEFNTHFLRLLVVDPGIILAHQLQEHDVVGRGGLGKLGMATGDKFEFAGRNLDIFFIFPGRHGVDAFGGHAAEEAFDFLAWGVEGPFPGGDIGRIDAGFTGFAELGGKGLSVNLFFQIQNGIGLFVFRITLVGVVVDLFKVCQHVRDSRRLFPAAGLQASSPCLETTISLLISSWECLNGSVRS